MAARLSNTDAAALGLSKAPKRQKYGNRRVEVDGVKFDSKHEGDRWAELQLLQKADHITDLRRQVPFDLKAYGGLRVGRYIADFVYREAGKEIVEDAKGVKTALYRWKARHMLAQYGIAIRET